MVTPSNQAWKRGLDAPHLYCLPVTITIPTLKAASVYPNSTALGNVTYPADLLLLWHWQPAAVLSTVSSTHTTIPYVGNDWGVDILAF